MYMRRIVDVLARFGNNAEEQAAVNRYNDGEQTKGQSKHESVPTPGSLTTRAYLGMIATHPGTTYAPQASRRGLDYRSPEGVAYMAARQRRHDAFEGAWRTVATAGAWLALDQLQVWIDNRHAPEPPAPQPGPGPVPGL